MPTSANTDPVCERTLCANQNDACVASTPASAARSTTGSWRNQPFPAAMATNTFRTQFSTQMMPTASANDLSFRRTGASTAAMRPAKIAIEPMPVHAYTM